MELFIMPHDEYDVDGGAESPCIPLSFSVKATRAETFTVANVSKLGGLQ